MPRCLSLAALLIVVAGCSPATSPSPSPSAPMATAMPASASPAPSVEAATRASRLAGMARPLSAGRYVYEDAFPHVTFEVPTDWWLAETMPRHFGIRPMDVLAEDSINTWFDMRLASTDPTCPEEPQPSVGPGAMNMAHAFKSTHGVITMGSTPIKIGGLDGVAFDLGLDPTWTKACPFTNGVPSVPLFVDDGIDGEPAFWGVSGPERIRMIVLDDRHGSNVLITIDSATGKTLDALWAAAMPVLDTYRFDLGS
jgi:hypothetical protein